MRNKLGILKKVRCGVCMECLKQNASAWTGRLLMEYITSGNRATFATFTYSDEFLPEEGVSCREMTLLIKRMRQRLPGIRYFGVGEYGGMFGRPHYHFLLFNDYLHNSPLWLDLKPDDNSLGYRCRCPSWRFGHVTVEEACPDNIAYCAGYVKSKLDPVKNGILAAGRNPVCNTMSLKPAIGYQYMIEHKDKLISDGCVKLGGSEYVLPKYFKEKIMNEDDRAKMLRQVRLDVEAQFNADFEAVGDFYLANRLREDRLLMREKEHDFKEVVKQCGK